MKEQLIHSLYQIGSLQFGEFVFKSGVTSPFYINIRKIISYPKLLRQIAEAMWQATQDKSFDLVCGVPYTALPIATCYSIDHDIPMVMRRKEKKDYGTKQMVEGVFKPHDRCLIIEDVITTGSSILETAAELEKSDIIVSHIVCLVDRQEQNGKQNLEKKYSVTSLLTLSDILNTLLASSLLKTEEKIIVETLLKR